MMEMGTDFSGDLVFLVVTACSHGPPGSVLHHDHETDVYSRCADTLAQFLKISNDLVEADPDRAFFQGDHVLRVFQFPGTAELVRQLDAGLDVNHSRSATGGETLLEEASRRGRLDLVEVLLARGANPRKT
jgi:hypothetical protein